MRLQIGSEASERNVHSPSGGWLALQLLLPSHLRYPVGSHPHDVGVVGGRLDLAEGGDLGASPTGGPKWPMCSQYVAMRIA